MKYNYLIIASYYDYYKILYQDAIALPNVTYRDKPSNKNWVNKLFRIHLDYRINKKINIPYKSIWARQITKSPYNTQGKDLCFVIFYNWICLNVDILETIRQKYPHAKIVVVFNDLISLQKLRLTNIPIDIYKVKEMTDLVISYDFGDAEKYGLEYHSLPFSKPSSTHPISSSSDVYIYW